VLALRLAIAAEIIGVAHCALVANSNNRGLLALRASSISVYRVLASIASSNLAEILLGVEHTEARQHLWYVRSSRQRARELNEDVSTIVTAGILVILLASLAQVEACCLASIMTTIAMWISLSTIAAATDEAVATDREVTELAEGLGVNRLSALFELDP